MGRARKPFIDKKNSTTYNLIYRAGEVEVDGEVAEQPQRQLVDARLGIGIGRPDEESVTAAQSRQPDGHPLLWLEVHSRCHYPPNRALRPSTFDANSSPCGPEQRCMHPVLPKHASTNLTLPCTGSASGQHLRGAAAGAH